MYGDPALLDTIMGEIPDTLDSEDMIYQSDTDDSGDGTEERHGESDEAGDDKEKEKKIHGEKYFKFYKEPHAKFL